MAGPVADIGPSRERAGAMAMKHRFAAGDHLPHVGLDSRAVIPQDFPGCLADVSFGRDAVHPGQGLVDRQIAILRVVNAKPNGGGMEVGFEEIFRVLRRVRSSSKSRMAQGRCRISHGDRTSAWKEKGTLQPPHFRAWCTAEAEISSVARSKCPRELHQLLESVLGESDQRIILTTRRNAAGI